MANFKFVIHMILILVMCVILQYCEADMAGTRPQPRPRRLSHLDSMAQSAAEADEQAKGTTWAVLVAGSNGYDNYRHQVRYVPRIKYFS